MSDAQVRKLALDVYSIQKTKAKLLSDIHLEHIQNVLRVISGDVQKVWANVFDP